LSAYQWEAFERTTAGARADTEAGSRKIQLKLLALVKLLALARFFFSNFFAHAYHGHVLLLISLAPASEWRASHLVTPFSRLQL